LGTSYRRAKDHVIRFLAGAFWMLLGLWLVLPLAIPGTTVHEAMRPYPVIVVVFLVSWAWMGYVFLLSFAKKMKLPENFWKNLL
jgi:hypothetical protein